MVRFVIIRFLQAIASLIGISILIFVLVRASGDPTMLMRTATSTEEDIQNIRVNLGLDKSYPEQYWIFLKGMVQFDFGKSLVRNNTVMNMIGEALPNTLKLALVSFFVGMLLATALGVLAATRRDTWIDNVVKFVAILGQGLPGFWVAIMAMYIFCVYWQILPISGMDSWQNYVIPVGAMSFFLLPGMMRLVRSSMMDVLDSEYIKLGRIKGLPERTIIWKHALRNAIIAPLTAAGMIFAGLITGEVIIETVFSWPGVGRLMVDALTARDFPVVQGVTILVAVLVLGINLLVDILYAYIDPQIRYQKT
jgi:peptide/nickel transport system permease protein